MPPEGFRRPRGDRTFKTRADEEGKELTGRPRETEGDARKSWLTMRIPRAGLPKATQEAHPDRTSDDREDNPEAISLLLYFPLL